MKSSNSCRMGFCKSKTVSCGDSEIAYICLFLVFLGYFLQGAELLTEFDRGGLERGRVTDQRFRYFLARVLDIHALVPWELFDPFALAVSPLTLHGFKPAILRSLREGLTRDRLRHRWEELV